jgi:hypothetical protein
MQPRHSYPAPCSKAVSALIATPGTGIPPVAHVSSAVCAHTRTTVTTGILHL